jgi:hypothetical protein
MSIQAGRAELAIIDASGPDSGPGACSPPLIGEPLGEAVAAGLAAVFIPDRAHAALR